MGYHGLTYTSRHPVIHDDWMRTGATPMTWMKHGTTVAVIEQIPLIILLCSYNVAPQTLCLLVYNPI